MPRSRPDSSHGENQGRIAHSTSIADDDGYWTTETSLNLWPRKNAKRDKDASRKLSGQMGGDLTTANGGPWLRRPDADLVAITSLPATVTAGRPLAATRDDYRCSSLL